jgi:hypothetical protein
VSLRNPSVDWLQVVSIAVCILGIVTGGMILYSLLE